MRAKSAANLPTGTGKAAAAAAERASRGGSAAASLAGVDLEEELEHVHMELRTFLNKKRARKAGVAGVAQQEGTPGSASKGGQVCITITITITVVFCSPLSGRRQCLAARGLSSYCSCLL